MEHKVQLGLRENAGQFTLLVIANAFVGGMVGLERSILPQIAEGEFGIAARTAILSFIVVFGVTKAITNYYAGALSNRIGRRNLLIVGWALALPVPFLLMWAPTWNWVVATNVLLGIHQGFAWSTTVVMKIDLVGERNRGLAMGLNEFAGYISVAFVAFFTGWVAAEYGLRPYPFYIGVVLAVAGLLTTVLFIKDTRHHVAAEAAGHAVRRLKSIFWDTTWRDRVLGSVTQAGLVNNLNDGMMWGLFPILMAVRGYGIAEIGIVTGVYPAVWGMGQLVTGKMADHFNKRHILVVGMLLQGAALFSFPFVDSLTALIALAAVLGWGTAMVYPTFLATIAENTHPTDRAASLGVFRLWRDLGYAVGAILTGIIADTLGMATSVFVVAALTTFSAGVIFVRMRTGPSPPLG